MRTLLAIVVAAALGWGGWWWWNATSREAAVDGWLAERRAAGWVAEAADVRVAGFPNRLDLVVSELELADPEAGWSWTAPEFQVLSLTWSPHHVIAVWPGEQAFASPFETVRIESDLMRGSVVFVPAPGLALDRSTIELDAVVIAGESGWSATLGNAILATRRSNPAEAPRFAHDVSFKAEGLALPPNWTVGLERTGVLPAHMEATDLDATLIFDRPWDQAAIEGETPALEGVTIRDLRVSWGRLDLRGRGELVADARGFAEGQIDLRVRNWREMLAIAVNADMIGRSSAAAVERGLGLVARLSAGRDSIEVPLVFEDGRASIGIGGIGAIAVGDAPRLTGRR